MGDGRVVHVGGALNDQAADNITMQAFRPGFSVAPWTCQTIGQVGNADARERRDRRPHTI
jgi:hypothetical protein